MIDPVTASASPSSPWRRRTGVLLATLAFAAYAMLLARHVGTYAAGSDASGYMNHARLLAAGNLHATPRVLSGLTPEEQRSMLFSPLGFVPAPDGNGLVPTYPAGLPLLIAAAAPIFGWEHAGDAVICAHALLGLLLVYAFGRTLGLSRRGAVLGTTIIAASPLYLNYSVQMMSDVPAFVWTLGAVLAAWRSRERATWALAAGAATALAVLIRPTNALIFAPIAVALGLSPRRWLLLAAGGVPGGIFFCFHNLSLYGHVFATGYGNFAASFSPGWIDVTWWHYACWLPVLFTPVVLLAAGLPWLARTEPHKAALLAVWALVFPAFYSAYDCTHQTWWYLRFILPAVPPLVIGGLLVARQLALSVIANQPRGRDGPPGRPFCSARPAVAPYQVEPAAGRRSTGRRWSLQRTRVFVFALIVIIANSALWNKRLMALNMGRDNEIYPAAAVWLKANLPGNAVILSMQMSGTLTYYTGFTFLRWDFCNADNRPHVLAALRNGHRPFYAALFPFEVEAALHEHMPGRWTRVACLPSELEVWRCESDDTAAGTAAVSPLLHETAAFAWLLPIDQPRAIKHAYLIFNGIAWLVLAALLWRLIPGNDWSDWLARGGILFSTGAIASIRFALTDLIALALLAGSMLALERRRIGWAGSLLGAAGIARGAALFALPALGEKPWLSRPNLRRCLPVLALVAVSTTVVFWHLGWSGPSNNFFAWPFGSFLDKWLNSFADIFQGQSLGMAWIGFVALISLTVQAAFFVLRWPADERWWRLGIAYVVLMCFLDDAMWRGAAGGATRLLLPLTLAFNVFARRSRASPAWLLAGNLAVATGFSSLFLPPDPPLDMAPIRAAGFAQLSDPDANWHEVEQSARHTWSWSRRSARLNIETWPHGEEPLVVSFALRSLTPRTVVIRQGEQVLWSGAINRDYTRATFPCRIANGHGFLDLATDSPAAAENSAPHARVVAFAIYDPFLALSEH
jgi:hypothetical protein